MLGHGEPNQSEWKKTTLSALNTTYYRLFAVGFDSGGYDFIVSILLYNFFTFTLNYLKPFINIYISFFILIITFIVCIKLTYLLPTLGDTKLPQILGLIVN